MNQLFKFIILALALGLTACGDSGGNKSDDSNSGGVRWEKIPATFNPNLETIETQLYNVQKIQMNLFGFRQDVRLQFSNELSQNQLVVQLYTVSKDARTSLSGIDSRVEGDTLELRKYGSYECSIKTSNGEVTAVKGACYIRVVLTLPAQSEIEVYNVGNLISKRYFAMDNGTFLKELDRASFDPEKLAVIDSYLASYQAIGRSPTLLAEELGNAINEFPFAEKKFIVLTKLHRFVSDRENLRKMIDDKFSFFDRDKAYKIAGL